VAVARSASHYVVDNVTVIDVVTGLNPESATAFINLGNFYEQNNRSAQAIESFRKSLEHEKTVNMRFWLEQKIK
jgi:tetratricopeptide (TPR) repeat protein